MIWDFSEEVINPNKPLDVTVSQLSQLHMISVNDLHIHTDHQSARFFSQILLILLIFPIFIVYYVQIAL